MYSKFLNIDAEKQQRILNVAMNEFATKGYSNASTNEIVKEAEISKGLLFHYFKNKKFLYLFLYNYCIDIVTKDFYEKIDANKSDFFDKLLEIQITKMDLVKNYPAIFKFLEVSYTEDANEIKQHIEDENIKLKTIAISSLFQNIDTSKFKEGVDLQKAINITLWTFEGYTNKLLLESKTLNKEINYNEAFNEATIYLEILKNSLYK